MIATAQHTWIRRVAYAVLGSYWAVMFISTHVPSPPDAVMLHASDKVLHFSAYAVLAFLLSLIIARGWALNWRVAAGVLAIIGTYGVLDELTQIPVGRHCDWRDWLADVAGGMFGIALYAIGQRLWGRRAAELPKALEADSAATSDSA